MGWRFCGQPLSGDELELIEGVVGSCTGVSRTELAATVCELLGWRRANGRLKSRECWALLEDAGALKLPMRRATKPKGAHTRVPRSAAGDCAPSLCAPLGELTPLSLTRVETPEQHRLWRSVKYEDVYLRAYETPSELRAGSGRDFEFYNLRRRHSALDRCTPDAVYYDQDVNSLAA